MLPAQSTPVVQGEVWTSASLRQHTASVPKRPSDYDLSLGKIIDTLHRDYPAMFERRPDFNIYDKHIVFELGTPFHAVSALHGKRRYRRALQALQHFACGLVQDGSVRCKVYDGTSVGKTLRVSWHCEGWMRYLNRPIYVSAISLYNVAERSPGTAIDNVGLSHTVHRHTIEFVEIQPPSLRSMMLSFWWRPQGKMVLQPAAHMHSLSDVELQELDHTNH